MDHHFWLERWETNNTPFHEKDTTPFLVAHLPRLQLAPGNRIFIPLCGKTRDIAWLRNQGYRVAGAELSAKAIDELFAELGVVPTITPHGALTHYHAPDIDIFVGDIFDLTPLMLGPVDAVYDRAALVALPPDIRARYALHLQTLTGQRASQLLITFEYDQSAIDGPPFAIPDEELTCHYAEQYTLALLDITEVEGGLKGKISAQEKVWLLTPKL